MSCNYDLTGIFFFFLSISMTIRTQNREKQALLCRVPTSAAISASLKLLDNDPSVFPVNRELDKNRL